MVSSTEFLTKQLNIQKEIVTFRCLSRALSMHVNDAKEELASFHTSSKDTDEPVHATFLLTGEVTPVNAYGSYLDEKDRGVDDDDESESVPTTKILLVSENELEAAKAQFMRLSSVHIYSLSPSAIRDATLLAPTADRVRQYVTRGKEFHQMVGIVIGADVKVQASAFKRSKESVGASKLNPLPQDKKLAERPKSSDTKSSAPEKGKMDSKIRSTLDWSKAKPKAEKEKEDATNPAKKAKEKGKDTAMVKKESKGKEKEKTVSKKDSKASLKEKPQDSKAAMKMESEESEDNVKKKTALGKAKRGTKRPSAVMSLSDSEEEQDDNPAPKTKPRTSASPLPSKPPSKSEKQVKVKKGVLISDDEDEASGAKPKLSRQKNKGKGRAQLSDNEDWSDRSVRAIMDLDDSHFTRRNQTSVEPSIKREEEEQDEEDVEMASDSEPIPARAKPKRKPKKVIPIGSNGLPKRRIVKSKRSKDARGYMVTVDYSSYESVSESEQVTMIAESEKKARKIKNKSRKESLSVSEMPTASEARPKPPSNKETAEGEASPAEQAKPTKGDGTSTSDSKNQDINPAGAKSSSRGKNNLMNYFGKK